MKISDLEFYYDAIENLLTVLATALKNINIYVEDEGKILNGTIQKAAMYAEMIEPRLKGGFNPSEKFSGQRIYPLLIYASHVSVYYFYQSRLSYFKSCRH